MQNYTSIVGSSEYLDYKDPSTWNVTIKLERVPKNVLLDNQIENLKFVSDPRIGQYEQSTEVERAMTIKNRLEDLHPWTGGRLRIKAEVLKPFDFRVLVHQDQASEPGQRSSHICLSYNWWSDQWLKPGTGNGFGLSPALVVDAYQGKFDIPNAKFPIADSMWNAFLAERETESEGVWADQLCIDQTNPAEIQNALLLMERIYKTARKVVVPLENVLLWSDEARAILKHIQAINSIPLDQRKDWTSWVKSADLNTLGASAYALLKIEGSRWFRRVWCNHEMRMGNDFVFMIPVIERTTPDDHAERVCVMKIDCKALTTLLASCRTMHLGTGLTHEDIMRMGYFKEALIDYELDRQPRAFMPVTVLAPDLDKFTPMHEISRKAKGAPSDMIPVMQTLCELSAYQNQHPRDVLHVLLDTVAPGLVYDDGSETEIRPLTLPEIAFMTNVVALASGDLSPLIATTSLNFWQENEIADLPRPSYSWAVFPSPHYIEWLGGLGRLGRAPDLKLTDDGLQLLVMVVGASFNITQTSNVNPDFVSQYSKIIENVLKFRHVVSNQDRASTIKNGNNFGKADEDSEAATVDPLYLRNFVDVMLLSIACGVEWMVDRATELTQLGLFPDAVDLVAQQKAYESLKESEDRKLWCFDYNNDLESEVYRELVKRWPEFKDYIAFFDGLLEFLIGPEWAHRHKSIDAESRVSLIDNNTESGSMPSQLLALPDAQEVGEYWLVRPGIIHGAARPEMAEQSGVDLRVGGTWAVRAVSLKSKANDTIDVLDDERTMSMGIWTNSTLISGPEDEENKRHQDETLDLKLISRNIRLFPSGQWELPMFAKEAVIHA